MPTNDDPRNAAAETPVNRKADQTVLVHELVEALTTLGNYLEAAHRQFEHRQQELGEALRASLGQYDRAVECLCRLRALFLREGFTTDDRSRSN